MHCSAYNGESLFICDCVAQVVVNRIMNNNPLFFSEYMNAGDFSSQANIMLIRVHFFVVVFDPDLAAILVSSPSTIVSVCIYYLSPIVCNSFLFKIVRSYISRSRVDLVNNFSTYTMQKQGQQTIRFHAVSFHTGPTPKRILKRGLYT